MPGYPRAITQTSDGFLWIATESALVRFDGERFTKWTPPPSSRIAQASFATIAASGDGSLWIGSTVGLSRLRGNSFTEFEELSGQFVVTLAVASEGTVWAGTNGGRGNASLCSVALNTVRCHGQIGEFGRFILSLAEDGNGRIWVGASNGLWQIDAETQRVLRHDPVSDEIHSIAKDGDHMLVAASRALLQATPKGLRAAQGFRGDRIRPTTMLQDREGGLWVGTQDTGLLRIRNGLIERLDRTTGLSGNFVVSLFEDREGSVWIGTLNGLDRFRDVVAVRVSSTDGLPDDTVVSVLRARSGGIWIGTLRGLHRWREGRVEDPRVLRLPESASVGSLYEDRLGQLWVSTTAGLYLLERGAGPTAKIIEWTTHVHSMTEDVAGTLWLADQQRGLIAISGGRLRETIPWSQLGGVEALAIAGDPRGGVWLGLSTGGLARVEYGRITARLGVAEGVAPGRVNSLHVSRDGTLWVSAQGGLTRVSRERVETLVPGHGLPCGGVLWVVESRHDALWLSTTCGLITFSRSNFPTLSSSSADPPIRLFDASDGVLPYSELGGYGPKATVANDGAVWFATYDGVSFIDEDLVPPARRAPKAMIEQVTADLADYSPGEPLRFGHAVRDLRIAYTGISINAPETVVFRYRLDGRDSDWVDAGHRREAYYTDLAPGEYVFRVVSGVNYGPWSAVSGTLSFTVPRPFYRRTSVAVSLTAVCLLLLYGAYVYRVRRLAKSYQNLLEARLAERSLVAQDLHDTLLQGFISCSMHLRLMVKEIADPAMRAKLDALATRIGAVVEDGRQAIGGLKHNTVDDVSQALAREAAALRGPNKIDVRLTVLGTPVPLLPLVRDAVYRVGREALANAYLHAGPTRVEIEVAYGPSEFRLLVRDNGRGFRTLEAPSDHWGLRGMHECAEAIGAALEVRSRPSHGTEVVLVVPNARAWKRQTALAIWGSLSGRNRN